MAGVILGAVFAAVQFWLLRKGVRSIGTEKILVWPLVLQFLCPLAALGLCAWLLRSQLIACAVAIGVVLLTLSAVEAVRLRRNSSKKKV